MGTLSNNSKVGDKGKDLILQTSGRVYVQVKDRFYEINFRGEDETKDKDVENSSKIIIIEDESYLVELVYPGDDYLIITKNGKLFITENQEYVEVIISSKVSTTFTSPLTITTLDSPFNINSSSLVKNLNAEYLNGIAAHNFARKDTDETISKWTINELISKSIRDQENKTIFNLENSSLTIDTIRVNNLIISDDSGGNNDGNSNINSESSFDIINKKTYFSNGIVVKSIKTIDKLESYTELFNTSYFANENYLVGGYSIIDLVCTAYDNFLLTELDNLVDYVNILTKCQKLNSDNQWVDYTPTQNDFELDENEIYPYKQYKFSPVDKSIYERYKYGTNETCLEGIYNKWYNINDYTQTTSSKYQGLTFEIETEKHSLNAGDLLVGENNSGIIEALVVGCTEFTIRIIISGIDCYFTNNTTISEYEEWKNYIPTEDPNKTIYETITACLESQLTEKGNSVSADPKAGDVLFTGDSGNIIGNITGIENSIFGTLEGYGLSSEGNCYFVNPGIAWTNESGEAYIKLTNQSDSFIGGSEGTSWINIKSNGDCSIKCLDMYDINTTGSCFFGPITIYKDGSAIIGNRSNAISIDSLGQVSIPKSCIVE